VSNAQNVCTKVDRIDLKNRGKKVFMRNHFLLTSINLTSEAGMNHCIAHCLDLKEPTQISNASQTPCYYNGTTGKCEFSAVVLAGIASVAIAYYVMQKKWEIRKLLNANGIPQNSTKPFEMFLEKLFCSEI
jgi:hypothetical protein